MNLWVLFSIFQLAVSCPDGIDWKLAFNIHASDGHNFGYSSDEWEDNSTVGTDTTAFNADYKSFDVTLEKANFIAIARHQNGKCEAVRVWKFLESGKTLHEYLDSDVNTRFVATYDNYTSSYISPTMLIIDKDPFFSVDGGIVFNWVWSNNGVRIANSEFYCGSDRPGEAETSDNYWGLGNDYGLRPDSKCWFDAGMTQCGGIQNQGTDHGPNEHMKDNAMFGQYAVYVSDEADSFPCKDNNLQISMSDFRKDFDRVNKDEDCFLNFGEFIFDTSDTDRDGQLSPQEYSEARSQHKLEDTASNEDVTVDFYRIDRDHNGFLNFNEVEYDIADTNNNGILSYSEYSMARADNSLRETV